MSKILPSTKIAKQINRPTEAKIHSELSLKLLEDIGSDYFEQILPTGKVFSGSIYGRVWTKSGTLTPPDGTRTLINCQDSNETTVCIVTFVLSGGEFTMQASYAGGSTFISNTLAVSSSVYAWNEVVFFIDWLTPANSLIYLNGISFPFATTPTAVATPTEIINRFTMLSGFYANFELAELWLGWSRFIQSTEFFKKIPTLSEYYTDITTGAARPYTLGSKGEIPLCTAADVYI